MADITPSQKTDVLHVIVQDVKREGTKVVISLRFSQGNAEVVQGYALPPEMVERFNMDDFSRFAIERGTAAIRRANEHERGYARIEALKGQSFDYPLVP